MACVCTVKLHVIVMCAPIRVTVATNVDAEGDDLDMEGGGHSLAHIIGAFHGPKRRPNPGHGSATGPSTAHKPHGQPPLPNCGQGMAGHGRVGPTKEEGGRLWASAREVFGQGRSKILVILNPTG